MHAVHSTPRAGLFVSCLLFLEVAAGKFYKDFYPQKQDYCLYGCQTVGSYITFNVSTDAAADYYTAACTNTLQIQSLYLCGQVYCSNQEIKHGLAKQNQDCLDYAGLSLPSFDDFALSPTELARIPRVDSSIVISSATEPLNHAVVPDKDWWGEGVHTVSAFYTSWGLGFDFSWACIGFWGLVLLIGILHRAVQFFQYSRADSIDRSSSLWLWIRSRLILPATVGKHCQEPVIGCTIPPRLESLLLLAYLAMNLIFMFPGYDLFLANSYYPDTRLQLARYISDRAGFLAIAQLPMVWLFAARNDPFLWLTGWSFATFSRFHRWIARAATIEAVVHSIGYTVYSFIYMPDGSDYRQSWTAEYWYCGAIATVTMCIMVGLSAWWFREKCYDLFLVGHIIFAIVCLVATFYHVKIFEGEFAGYLWPCVAFWCLDRLLRYARIIYTSILPRFAKRCTATATYHRGMDMIRLDVTDFIPDAGIAPGLFYYLYTPATVRGWESHPFTLCSFARATDYTSPSTSVAAEGKPAGAMVRALSPTSSGNEETYHSFLIRPYSGFTARLKNKIDKLEETDSCPVNVLLEGPYGHELDLSRYSDILVISGGSGITAAISHSNFVIPRAGTKVHIVWAVPQMSLVDDICGNELASVMASGKMDMVVYLTGHRGEAVEDGKLSTDYGSSGAKPYLVRAGRPDLEAVMREHRGSCERSLAIVTCGTAQMADACRAAIAKILQEEGPEIGFFNDSMAW